MSNTIYEIAEILYNDSFFQQCIRVIESNVLTREIIFKPRGVEPSNDFAYFIRCHYDPFIRQALRQIYAYGFVAWRIRKLNSGDMVPEALPLASFSWRVVPNKETKGQLLQYEITHCYCNVKIADVNVIPVTTPIYQGFSPTPKTPFDSVLVHYKNYKQAEQNTLNADTWNARAQIAHVHNSTQSNTMDKVMTTWAMNTDSTAQRYLSEMGAMNMDQIDDNQIYNNNDKIRFQKLKEAMEHQMIDHTQINWFPLTDDSQLKQLENLKVHTNFERMFLLYKEAVCFAMGIPTQLIIQNTLTSNSSTGGYNTGSRLFNNSMTNLAKQLSHCARAAYEKIYKESCLFELSPLSRLEITSYDTLQSLLEMENGIPPSTREAIMNDIHFQITGDKHRYIIYLERFARSICMHSSAQHCTNTIRFVVEQPHIKLTKKYPPHPAVSPQQTQTSRGSLPKNQEQDKNSQREKEIKKKSKLKKGILTDLFPFTQKEKIEITGKIFRYTTSLLLVISLIPQIKSQTVSVIRNVPVVWITPIVLNLTEDTGKHPQRKCTTLLFCLIFPLWLRSEKKEGESYMRNLFTFCLIVVVTIHTFKIKSWVWGFVLLIAACMLGPILILIPKTDVIGYTICTCLLIIMYQYKEDNETKNTNHPEN